MVMRLWNLRKCKQDRCADGLSRLPAELWPEIFWHLDEASLLATAGVCKAFNRMGSEVNLLRCGAALEDINSGTLFLRPTALSLAIFRASLYAFPRLKILSCAFRVDETLFPALRSLYRTIEQSAKLADLHVAFVHGPWLQEEHHAEFANLFHDIMLAITSKSDGKVVHVEPGTGISGRGRVEVSSVAKLCHEQIVPAYQPLSKRRLLDRLRKLSPHQLRADIPTIMPAAKDSSLHDFDHREWLHQHERASWCTISEIRDVVVSIVNTSYGRRLAIAVINPRDITNLRIRRTRGCSPFKKIFHQHLINDALPFVHFPSLQSIRVDAMHLDTNIFGNFLARHSDTLTEISSDANGLEIFYPAVSVQTALPHVHHLKAKSCAGMLALMNAVPPSEPCTFELAFDRWDAPLLHPGPTRDVASERELLRRLADRTGQTTLKLFVLFVTHPPTLEEADTALVRALRSVASVHLSCMNANVLEWLSYLPALKVLRVDKECLMAQPSDEAEFVKQAEVMFASRGIKLSQAGYYS